MTLTTILPSLRTSVPDPLDPRRWPAHTIATTTDVAIGGVSLSELAALCGTPCVHTEPASTRYTSDITIVLMHVTDTVHTAGDLIAFVDADLADHSVDWSELRVVGRASTAHVATARILARDARDGRGGIVAVPGDVRTGDLLAVPCRGLITHREVVTSEPDLDDLADAPSWLRGLE